MCVKALVHVPFVHLFLFPFPLFLPYFLFPPFRLSPPVPSGFTCGPKIRKSGEISPPPPNFSKLSLKPQIGVRSRKQGKPIFSRPRKRRLPFSRSRTEALRDSGAARREGGTTNGTRTTAIYWRRDSVSSASGNRESSRIQRVRDVVLLRRR